MKQQRLFAHAECAVCAGAGFVPVKVKDAHYDRRRKFWQRPEYRLMQCMACKGTGRPRNA